MSFIDENFKVFDNDDENKFEYTTIHDVRIPSVNSLKQFQKIVDELLCELMAELEITQE